MAGTGLEPVILRRPDHSAVQIRTRLYRIHELIDAGQTMKVPAFQRPYVWTVEDRLALADSIMSGIPIGSISVWTPKFYGDDRYVLDGQQRITSLVRMSDPLETDPDFQLEYVLDPDAAPFSFGVLARRDTMFLYTQLRKIDVVLDQKRLQAICDVFDAVGDFEVSVTTIQGKFENARRIYRRMNTTGVPVDLTSARDPDESSPTIADLIEEARRP